MDWITAIKSFLAVVDAHSFTKAAEKRHTSPAGISRQISWLEEHLNVILLTRTTRALQLTEEGKFFYQKGKQLIADLGEITQIVQKQQKVLSGPLKITLPISFGTLHPFVELIKTFSDKYPDIEINLDFSNQVRDLLADEVDIAFRAKPFDGASYTSFKILTLPVGLFASSSYLSKKGTPKSLEDLTAHNCLGHQYIGSMEWEFTNQKKVSVSGNTQSNASQPLIELAKSGQGIIRTLEIYVLEELKNNRLQPILKKEWPAAIPIYLLARSDINTPLRVKAFCEFAHQWFTKNKKL